MWKCCFLITNSGVKCTQQLFLILIHVFPLLPCQTDIFKNCVPYLFSFYSLRGIIIFLNILKICWAVSFLFHCVLLLRLLSLHRDWCFLLSDQGRVLLAKTLSRTSRPFLMFSVLLFCWFLRNDMPYNQTSIMKLIFCKICIECGYQ